MDLKEARELASMLDYYDGSGGNAASEAADVIRGLADEVDQLTSWQQKAFEAHPNIDLDIEALSP